VMTANLANPPVKPNALTTNSMMIAVMTKIIIELMNSIAAMTDVTTPRSPYRPVGPIALTITSMMIAAMTIIARMSTSAVMSVATTPSRTVRPIAIRTSAMMMIASMIVIIKPMSTIATMTTTGGTTGGATNILTTPHNKGMAETPSRSLR